MNQTASSAVDDLCSYLDASPSPRHAVASSLERLVGFERLAENEVWTSLPSRGVVVRGGALVAWHLPDRSSVLDGWRIVGAHTDSPCLRVKPHPDAGGFGWKQLAIEVYGGILNNSWLDRDLGVAGFVVDRAGDTHLAAVHEPVARVPQLAVHLDRDVNSGGLTLDPQLHLSPVWGVGNHSSGEFAEWLSDAAGLGEVPTWWELCLFDVQPAALLGADGSLLASGRLDNQLSCWAATRALVEAAASGSGGPALIVLNDHEEVGSSSTTGAGGPLLEAVLRRLSGTAHRNDPAASVHHSSFEDFYQRMIVASCCISADNAHAVHPNYPDRHEPGHRPVVGGGPAVKINANQRYATSPETAAAFERACDVADVPWQVFVSRNNMPCGSTIGPITSTRLGIPTADVGVPQLSMHSARELCGVDDAVSLQRALAAHFTL